MVNEPTRSKRSRILPVIFFLSGLEGLGKSLNLHMNTEFTYVAYISRGTIVQNQNQLRRTGRVPAASIPPDQESLECSSTHLLDAF